jgi:hypothetical protein
MRVQSGLDLTTADMLTALLRDLQDRGNAVRLADVHAPVRDLMRAQGLFEVLDQRHVLRTVDQAVAQLKATWRPST